MSNEDISTFNDIVSGNTGFTPSSVDDLFDIIEQNETDSSAASNENIPSSEEEAGFVQDDSFVNSLDFINGFSDITDEEIDQKNSEKNNEFPEDTADLNLDETIDTSDLDLPDEIDTSDLDIPDEAGNSRDNFNTEDITDSGNDSNAYEFGDAASENNDGFELNDADMSEFNTDTGLNTEETVNDSSDDGSLDEDLDDYSDEDLDEEDFEQIMIITEGTTISGSITTDCSLDIFGTVNGDVFCNGKLSISGKVFGNSHANEIMINAQRVEGNIECDGVVKIGQGSVIIGNISAGAAAIAGAVKGDLDVKGTVILDSTAVIKGNIKAKSVQLINGAVLEGFCSLEYANSNVDDIFN